LFGNLHNPEQEHRKVLILRPLVNIKPSVSDIDSQEGTQDRLIRTHEKPNSEGDISQNKDQSQDDLVLMDQATRNSQDEVLVRKIIHSIKYMIARKE